MTAERSAMMRWGTSLEVVCVLCLFAAAANAQDAAETFRCPDGTVVPLEAKGRPYRCPDTDAQRAANAEEFQRAAEKVKQDEEWSLTRAKLAEQIAENAGSIGSGWEETKAELVAVRLGFDAFLVEAHAAWSKGVAAKIAAESAQKKRAAADAAAKKQADAERAKAALICRGVFSTTIDKKASDLTVRETQQIKGCQTLDLYRQ
jgi:hypothetical protein